MTIQTTPRRKRKREARLLKERSKMSESTSTKCAVFSGKLDSFSLFSNARDLKTPMF